MALQGTIDSFAMADVLRLLAASAKSGRLIVNGDRGSASLWLADGQLVGGANPDPVGGDLGPVVFDILRFGSGSFIFEADALCPAPGVPAEVVVVLGVAEAALAEWHEIIKVVPSPASWITLAPELPHPEVVVDQACWASIVAVGGGTSVADLGTRLLLDELPASRLVRALVEAGFVEVGVAPTSTPSDSGPVEEPRGVAHGDDAFEYFDAQMISDLPMRHPVGGPLGGPLVEDGPAGFDFDDHPFADGSPDAEGVALPSLTVAGLSDEIFDHLPAVESEASAEELTRSMSMLSSKAAQALASLQEIDGGHQGGVDGVDEDEERTRMLRFLGSV